uniref:Morc S5 domain-containing protein n=1 Tax=Chenopodium quinoa TaxID=63459 RepID=A0A803MER1_CHEQI
MFLFNKIDYEKKGEVWTKIVCNSLEYWHVNLEAIVQWSPFSNEQDLLQQFDSIRYQGTRIIIYNLWEDDGGQLELDFGTDPHSYASILYLRIPLGFRIILRGQDVMHHELVNDMIPSKHVSYRPMPITNGTVKDSASHLENPFWRVWNAAGSDGRAVIGTLFSYEYSKLWRDNCHEIGYAPRINKVVPTVVSSPLPIRGNGNAVKGMTSSQQK